MEIGAQNEGLSRTELTPDRLNVALSTILTKEVCIILQECICSLRVLCLLKYVICHFCQHFPRFSCFLLTQIDVFKIVLMTLLLIQMLPSQVLKVPQYPRDKSELPECGQEFCRMGCVCLSLQCSNRGPLHCRRPECMFGCSCFKRKIIKQLNSGETEESIQPLYCKIRLF